MAAQKFVALDIETTGLDPQHDRITEIAAVRLDDDGAEVDSFATLVNPGRAIPRFIETMTGVTNDAVRDAPRLADVASALLSFVGDATIVGQNIGFDLAHLQRAGVAFAGRAIDTAELSRILVPGRLDSRGLAGLATALGVEPAEYHRALPDARTAAAVFTALRRKAAALPAEQRGQLARLISLHDLAMAEVIAGPAWEEIPITERALPALRPAPSWPPLAPSDPLVASTPELVAAVMAAGATALAGYEDRPEQKRMAAAVHESFARGGHYLIEAGTGVGKSLAYLVPAALHALSTGERVVVSTNTINLQEQLLTQDVPTLRRMLVAAGVLTDGADLRVTVLKGRANYLCLRRWKASYGAGAGDPDFAHLAASMLLWLPATETGDRSELNFDYTDWLTWQRFSAQDADCLSKPDRTVREGNCFLQRARKAAESAHIIIANHALLLADIAAGGSALPAYDHVVIDEAHNLEDQATNQFGGTVSRRLMIDALDGLHRSGNAQQREGGVVALLKAFAPGAARDAGLDLEQTVRAAAPEVHPFFRSLAALVPKGGEEDRQVVDRGLRAQPAWAEPERLWDALDGRLRAVGTAATKAAHEVTASAPVDEPDAIAAEVESAARKLADLRALLEVLMSSHDDETIVWLARDRDDFASLGSAPLDVGPTLWDNLLSHKRTVVATSATLSAAGDMAYTSRRLGFQDPDTLQLGSPFDYERSTLLAAFTDLPEPSDPAYIDRSADAIARLACASEGRALVLFTSHAALRRTAEAARRTLEEAGIAVLVQGTDGTPKALTEQLKAAPRSVIFGTSSFWEGVDVRGDALSLLVIARLPFAVPTDPVHRARSEQYDDPFREYSLPAAILRFRQGFGRLIRDRTDRGVVAVLDSRIHTKKYGETFVAALPRCAMLLADTDAVARRTREWLAP